MVIIFVVALGINRERRRRGSSSGGWGPRLGVVRRARRR
jgi:hypothetical protein